MPLNVKIEKSPIPQQSGMYVAKIMSGYRQGSFMETSSSSYPQHFSSIQQATQWLTDTGYTIVS